MPYADYEEQKAFQRRWAKKRRAMLAKLKKGPCTDCGKTFHHAAMDFDHVRGKKDLKVASMIISRSWDMAMKEIEKCELVCANCHRIRTHKREQYAKQPSGVV